MQFTALSKSMTARRAPAADTMAGQTTIPPFMAPDESNCKEWTAILHHVYMHPPPSQRCACTSALSAGSPGKADIPDLGGAV